MCKSWIPINIYISHLYEIYFRISKKRENNQTNNNLVEDQKTTLLRIYSMNLTYSI